MAHAGHDVGHRAGDLAAPGRAPPAPAPADRPRRGSRAWAPRCAAAAASGRRRPPRPPAGVPCRPAGRRAANEAISALLQALRVGRVAGAADHRQHMRSGAPCSVGTSGCLRARHQHAQHPRAAAAGRWRAPEVVMISVRLLTRCGCLAAMCCAIMPPIDAPQMCACAMPSASSTPSASAAMSATW